MIKQKARDEHVEHTISRPIEIMNLPAKHNEEAGELSEPKEIRFYFHQNEITDH